MAAIRKQVRGKEAWGIALLAIAVVVAGRATSGQGAPLGAFDGHGDVGSPKIAGSATYNAVSQEYALAAGGVNMWAQRDEFQFAWKRMTGDFILQARVELLGKGVEPHRKAGWMIRPSQEADAPYVDGVVHGDGLTSLQFRRTKGAITEQKEMTIKGPDVIQLERKGGTYIFSAAKCGDPFTVVDGRRRQSGRRGPGRPGLVLAQSRRDRARGLPRRADHQAGEGQLRPVSRLHRQRARDPRRRDRAPPDRPQLGAAVRGAQLDARRQRADLQPERARRKDGAGSIASTSPRGRPRSIDTGFANRNNNDHVLSFDGTMLGISDQSQASGGRSTVYTVPVGGGTPKRITTQSPSYLHSWSPDGKDLIFTGGRNNEFDIYRIPADGSGPEVNLTNTTGLDDGPEYTPRRASTSTSTRRGPGRCRSGG